MTGVASFWTQRRAAVKAEEAAEAAVQQAAPGPDLAERTDAEILAELKLPDPDLLESGDNFAAFMSKAVPEHLRKRALRKLWRSNPVLACVDGLNDYDDDYLTGSTGNGAIATTYQVGKGLLAHLLEMERQAAPVEEVEEVEEDEAEILLAEAEEPSNERSEPVEEASAYRPRRMRFEFDEDTA